MVAIKYIHKFLILKTCVLRKLYLIFIDTSRPGLYNLFFPKSFDIPSFVFFEFLKILLLNPCQMY